jgi:hypothetical protein
MPSKKRAPLGLIAAALYFSSLATPAIVASVEPLISGGIFGPGGRREETMFGAQCLLIGWMTIPGYANLLLAIAAIGLVCRRFNFAAVCSALAFVLAMTTFGYIGEYIAMLHIGFFLWIASMVVVFVAAVDGPRRRLEAPGDAILPGCPPGSPSSGS